MKIIFVLLFFILFLTTCTRISIQKEKASRDELATPSAAVWYGKATATNDPIKKIEYLSKVIKQKPDFTSAYLERGRAYNQIAQYDSAITDLNIFIQTNPDVAEAYSMRGKAFEAKRYLNDALTDYSKSIEISPQPQTYIERANLLKQRRRYSKAILDYTEEIKGVPNNADIYIARRHFIQFQ